MLTSSPCTDLLRALLAARLDFPVVTRNREGFSKRSGQIWLRGPERDH